MKRVIVFFAVVAIGISAFSQSNEIVKYARYEHGGMIGYGLVENNMIIPIKGDIFSKYITFEPGDALFLGTPGITKQMEPGDTVEISIEGIEILRNTVISD